MLIKNWMNCFFHYVPPSRSKSLVSYNGKELLLVLIAERRGCLQPCSLEKKNHVGSTTVYEFYDGEMNM